MDDILTGTTNAHVETWQGTNISVHKEMSVDLQRFAQAANVDGFKLAICSGFRSFESQLAIWNGKVSGTRPVLDEKGSAIDIKLLTPEVLLTKILRWSALPGLSRHHWGTDIDVYDAGAVDPDYKLQLTVAESRTTFGDFHQWLDINMESFGFYRPYLIDRGGVSPEPWHLSYANLSSEYYLRHSVEILEKVLVSADIMLKAQITKTLPSIFEKYFLNIDQS